MSHLYRLFRLALMLLAATSCDKGDFIITDQSLPEFIEAVERYDDPDEPKDEKGYELLITKYMDQIPIGMSVQGADCYGDILFQFQHTNSAVLIYDLKEKEYLGRVPLPPNAHNHCNNVSFSRLFYEEGDEFPLLYVSGSQSGTYNHIQVYRILRAEELFAFEQVQEIVLPQAGPGNRLYWTGAVMDNESNSLYVYANYNNATIARFAIPDIRSSSVTLTDGDIKDIFPISVFSHQQGAVIKDGYMYVFDGVPQWGDINYLRIIDLTKRRDFSVLNVTELGLTYEPEGAFFYKGELFCATNNAGLFRFSVSVK